MSQRTGHQLSRSRMVNSNACKGQADDTGGERLCQTGKYLLSPKRAMETAVDNCCQ